MHGLRSGAFILSQGDCHAAGQEDRPIVYFSVSTGFC
jgi:hypothetical protein